jgi:hypothetical protein
MSRSHHTRPPARIARTEFPRDREGKLILPRVIQREPYPGDIHPITRKHVLAFLRRLPIEYVYGLTSVDLLPRKNPVGEPFGLYMNDERRVVLYSMPWPGWRFKSLSAGNSDWYETHGAKTVRHEDSVEIHWPREIDLAYFMFSEVFLHELGHHHQKQYERKYKYPRDRNSCEDSANRHARLLSKENAFAIWHAAIKPGSAAVGTP